MVMRAFPWDVRIPDEAGRHGGAVAAAKSSRPTTHGVSSGTCETSMMSAFAPRSATMRTPGRPVPPPTSNGATRRNDFPYVGYASFPPLGALSHLEREKRRRTWARPTLSMLAYGVLPVHYRPEACPAPTSAVKEDVLCYTKQGQHVSSSQRRITHSSGKNPIRD